MRFIIGSPPVGQIARSSHDGWREFPSLGAKSIQSYGLLVSCLGILLVGGLLRWVVTPISVWTTIPILIIALPLHELIHAISTPAWGFSNRTVIGFQGGKGLMLPYMYFDGNQPLWHMLLTGVSPLVSLTILPVILILFAPLNAAQRADLGFLAFFNVAISGGDLVNFYWLITHLPFHAVVMGNGWGLLWKNCEPGHKRQR